MHVLHVNMEEGWGGVTFLSAQPFYTEEKEK